MQNPQKIKNVVNTVKDKLASKMESGDISREDLMEEALKRARKLWNNQGDRLPGNEYACFLRCTQLTSRCLDVYIILHYACESDAGGDAVRHHAVRRRSRPRSNPNTPRSRYPKLSPNIGAGPNACARASSLPSVWMPTCAPIIQLERPL